VGLDEVFVDEEEDRGFEAGEVDFCGWVGWVGGIHVKK
jgi:hypothetical protein